MKRSGIQVSKQIFMALVNAYATCGQFEKAKQVSMHVATSLYRVSYVPRKRFYVILNVALELWDNNRI